MRGAFIRYSIVFFLFIRATLIYSQANTPIASVLREEKKKITNLLTANSVDQAITKPLSEFVSKFTDEVYQSITTNATLTNPDKEKAVRSLVYFLTQIGEDITIRPSEIYDIASAFETYKKIINNIYQQKSIENDLSEPGAVVTQLMAIAFRDYDEHQLIEDIAVYKRMSATPEFITRFLESRPSFQFADSLILVAATDDPRRIIKYLKNGKPSIINKIRGSENKYLQEIIALAGDKNVSELLPFIIQLADGELTQEEILEKRLDVGKYFQLMVNTLIATRTKMPSNNFVNALRIGIKEKSLAFYVNQVNEQHSDRDEVRFASVKSLRPEDIYFAITSCEEELYTSSYLGLYSRLLQFFKNQAADSLFSIVNYDNFQVFMRMAANYNTLSNFLDNMNRDNAVAVLSRFIAGIEKNTSTGLEKAMDVADAFSGINDNTAISDLIREELQANLERCRTTHSYYGVRLYSILLQVYDLVVQKQSFDDLWSKLGNYETLKRSSLLNKDGEIIQLVLFYGDKDGISSFNNFLSLFTDTLSWEISSNNNWVTIQSVNEHPIVIYANRPLDNKEQLDLKAQDSLFMFLKQQSLQPVVLIHRGHSYHLENTLKRLTPSVKLAILGSCGGYNNAISIATINPDAQLIVSKKIGTKMINDPIIDEINKTFINNEDISWPDLWAKLENRFSKDEKTLNLFYEYIPPGKNMSLFVLKLFNYYKRPA